MLRNIPKLLAKTLMEIYPNYPVKDNISLHEIFRQDEYTQASEEEQNRIKLSSAQFRYDYEKQRGFFDVYFPNISSNEFHKNSILDLGSFTGGRLVHWVERYNFSDARGIDIYSIFAEAGNMFAKEKGANATFDTGFAESLPYAPNSFDFIVSFDVFEHVQNIEQVMQECFRVLKPGGKLLAVFPPFFQPLETHLGMVTKMPALHWFFSGKTILDAYNEILKKRGKEAYWYAIENPELAEWERSPSLNGITVGKFRQIVAINKGWNILYWSKEPILSDGKRANMLIFRILRKLFVLPARLPILEELFLGRICCSLEKIDV
jgi:ubiquinone/menaquinone biosynthesis C-methylase UbiE